METSNSDKEQKVKEIVSGVLEIPIENWVLKQESGMIPCYVTSKNETGIILYRWASDGGKPFLIISEIQFWDDRLIDLWYNLSAYTNNKKEAEENDKIQNLHELLLKKNN